MSEVEKAASDLGEIGNTGLRVQGGWVAEDPDKGLRGQRGISIYDEMARTDPTIGGMLFAVDMLVRRVPWTVQPASDDAADVANAQFVIENMGDMSSPWSDVISEALTMLPFGWSWLEVVLKQRNGIIEGSPGESSAFTDGKLGWRKMPGRSQASALGWVYDDETGELLGMKQTPKTMGKPVIIPLDRSLHFRTATRRGNPEGLSVLRSAHRPWYFKKRLEELEGIGMERDLAGLPMALVPPEILATGASAEQITARTAIEKLVTQLRRDEQEGIVFPLQWDENGNMLYKLELLTTGGQRQFDMDKTITRYDVRILMTLMADFLLLGHTSVGSFALSDRKTAMFLTALETFTRMIADVFNRHAIPRLLLCNAMPGAPPKLVPGDIEDIPVAELMAILRDLALSGAELFPDEELENWLRDKLGAPARATGEF